MTTRPPIRFGTDGVRGPVGEWPLNSAGAQRIGQALGTWAGDNSRVVIGWDTRQSSPIFAKALADGVQQSGAHALFAGILPTAGVSTAVLAEDCQAGAMITASHNPWTDNGIKVVGGDGKKLTDIQRFEGFLDAPKTDGAGQCHELQRPAASWENALPEVDLSGLTILLDCANGAAFDLAPKALEMRGANVIRRGCEPSGKNINLDVGALHPPSPEWVRQQGCDFAICLDGDADRVLIVDPDHGLLDGDSFLWVLSRQTSGPLIGTIMSNGGLEQALNGRLLRSKVGDRHVAELMKRHQAQVGAEPSGHILFADGMPTGDGLFAALRLLAAAPTDATGRPDLSSACQGWTRWKQSHRNLRFTGPRRPLDNLRQVQAAQASGSRVVIRYSGTEPLLRIMVEGLGSGESAPHAWVDRIAKEFEQL